MAFSLKRILLSQIDWDDFTFRITTDHDYDTLIPSIREMGVIHPPLLTPKKQKDQKAPLYQIVSGFKRLLASRKMEMTSLDVRVGEENTSSLSFSMHAIMENALHRPLNLIECARAYRLLYDQCQGADKENGQEQTFLSYAKRIGLENSMENIHRIMGFLFYPPLLQESIASGKIGIAVSLMLSEMEPPLRDAFGELFSQLPFNMNKQRELITMITEIARKEGVDPLSIFDEQAVSDLIGNPDIKAPQKAQKLRYLLKKRRFPHLTLNEEAFVQWNQSLNLLPSMALTPPPFFEGPHYTLTLRFKSMKELLSQKEKIGEILQNPQALNILDS